MRIASILLPEAVFTGMSASGKDDAVAQLVSALAQARSVDTTVALRDLAARESAGPTLIPLGGYLAAVPHTSTKACKQLMLAVGTSREGIPWGQDGKRANLMFLLLGPSETHALYLRVLARIGRLSRTPVFVEAMIAAGSPEAFIRAQKALENNPRENQR